MSNIWGDLFIYKEYRWDDKVKQYHGYYILEIRGREIGQYENQTQAELAYMNEVGIDPTKWRCY